MNKQFLIILFIFSCNTMIAQISEKGVGIILKGHTNDLYAAKFSPAKAKILATAGLDQKINIYKADSPFSLVTSWPAHDATILSLVFNATGSMLASASKDNHIGVWDSLNRKVVFLENDRFKHNMSVNAVTFDRGGKYLFSGCDEGKIVIWDLINKKAVKEVNTGVPVNSLVQAINAAAVYVAGAESNIKLINLTNGAVIKTLTGHKDVVNHIEMSKNYKYLLSGSNDKSAKLWDVKTSTCIRTFAVDCWKVNAVAFSDDSRYCATGCNDGSIKIWEVETGNLIHHIENAELNIKDISFSPNGKWIAVSGLMRNSTNYGPRLYRSGIPSEDFTFGSAKTKEQIALDSIVKLRPLNHKDSIVYKQFISKPKLDVIGSSERSTPKATLDSARIYKTPMVPLKK